MATVTTTCEISLKLNELSPTAILEIIESLSPLYEGDSRIAALSAYYHEVSGLPAPQFNAPIFPSLSAELRAMQIGEQRELPATARAGIYAMAQHAQVSIAVRQSEGGINICRIS